MLRGGGHWKHSDQVVYVEESHWRGAWKVPKIHPALSSTQLVASVSLNMVSYTRAGDACLRNGC